MKVSNKELQKNKRWIIWIVFGILILILIIYGWSDFVRGLTGQKF